MQSNKKADPKPSKTSFSANPDNFSTERYERYKSLIQSIFQRDIQRLQQVLKEIKEYNEHSLINLQDVFGNTLIMLNVKLNSITPQAQFDISNILLENGADVNIADNDQKFPFNQAVQQKNHKLALSLYRKMGRKDFSHRESEMKIGLDKQMFNVDDFYIEMNYQINNSFIPLIQHIAPSDTLKIWKIGNQFRSEQTYAGYDKKSKIKKILRKKTCFMYNPDTNTISTNGYYTQKKDSFQDQVVFTCPEHEIYTTPIMQITDSQYVQNMINHQMRIEERLKQTKEQKRKFLIVDDIQYQESKSLFGRPITNEIEGHQAQKYDIKIDNHICYYHKTNDTLNINFKEYQENYMQKPNHEEFCKDRQHPMLKQKKLKYVKFDKGKSQQSTLALYMRQDYPLKFQDIFIVLEFLINLQIENQKQNGEQEHPILANLLQLLTNKNMQTLFQEKGFPVKMQVPLIFKFHADISFSNVRVIKNIEEEKMKYPDLFLLPQQYQQKHWREAKLIIDGTYDERMYKYQQQNNSNNNNANNKKISFSTTQNSFAQNNSTEQNGYSMEKIRSVNNFEARRQSKRKSYLQKKSQSVQNLDSLKIAKQLKEENNNYGSEEEQKQNSGNEDSNEDADEEIKEEDSILQQSDGNNFQELKNFNNNNILQQDQITEEQNTMSQSRKQSKLEYISKLQVSDDLFSLESVSRQQSKQEFSNQTPRLLNSNLTCNSNFKDIDIEEQNNQTGENYLDKFKHNNYMINTKSIQHVTINQQN